MLSQSFFPNFGQGPFPKIAGKGPGVKLGIEGSLVRNSPLGESLCYVLEHDFIHCLVLVQLRRTGNRPDVTEKLLTGT